MKIIKKCPLFEGIDEKDLISLSECLKASEKSFRKNQFVFHAGDNAVSVGVVLEGSVHILQEDYWGNRTIIAGIDAGELFAEAFSCAGLNRLPVSVQAAQDTKILLIDYRRIIYTCSDSCSFHNTLVRNMVSILASKNVFLTQKIEHITQHTTRDKLLSYFSAQAQRVSASAFEIPFSRQQLAEYLSVDRSAMSSELSKMRDDGIIEYNKNHFELIK